MKIKTAELTGVALDWAVQEAKFKDEPSSKDWVMRDHATGHRTNPYSTDCCWGFSIIDDQGIMFYSHVDGDIVAYFRRSGANGVTGKGKTHLIAAMRCYCCSKLDDEVEVPDELI